jgi:phage protein D
MTNPAMPAIFVKVGDGKRQHRVDVSHKILSFEYTDSEKKSDELKLTVDNFALESFDNPIWRKGNIIECSWGVAGKMSPLRHVCIHSTKGFNPLTVVAKGGLTFMNEVVISETYEDVRDSDVVRKIVERNGWSDPGVQFIADTTDRPRTIIQPRLTDAQMLRRLAHRNRFVVFVDFDGFHFHERDVSAKPIREYVYYSDPGIGDILSINIENDIMARPRAVKVSGRDPDKKKTEYGGASNGVTERALTALVLDAYELGEAIAGSSVMQTFEAAYNASNTLPNANSISAFNQTISGFVDASRREVTAYYPRPLKSEDDAKVEVQKDADRRFTMAQQGTVKLNMTVRGDAFVLAKTTFMLGGVGKRLSGKYYIKEAVHKLTGSGGYDVTIKAISDGTNGYRREAYDGFLDRPARGSTGDKIPIIRGTTLIEDEELGLLSVGISPVGFVGKFKDVKGRPFPRGVTR